MSKSLLIVDDEPSVLETTRFILEAEGYEVLTARTGVDALKVLRIHHPHVVLLDVMMPMMDGYAVCREIRRDPALAGTHVIMLTAKGQRVDEECALEAGANAYLKKPFEEEQVIAQIEAAYATYGD